ncbi:filamentous hemagglutinin [Cyanosarcina cf. burmensis CCALA 770]|nr:filamentous hemagglutinin [Cyanosarcina cf. burmensis CCALA 770]
MPTCTKISFVQRGLVNLLTIVGVSIIFEPYSLAQIAPDNSLDSENSLVTPNSDINGIPSDRVDGGAVRGTNLFHSFQEFNIDEGRGVYFTNPSGVENILSRVTGNNPSNIFGKLGVLGSANLFLLNPNGIVFGANSSLDLRGSFVASTATALNFADGAKFTATPQATPILTVSVPIGLGFGQNPTRISVRGNGQGVETPPDELANSNFGLQVQPDRTLALVGGDLDLQGATLKTSGGRIELGSVTSPSSVKLNPATKGWMLEYASVTDFGKINLSDGTAVNATGAGGGDIQVVGRQIQLSDASQIDASTLGAAPSGQIIMNASEAIVLGGSRGNEQLPTGILTTVYPGAQGTGGDIILETKRLEVKDGAQIGTRVEGEGNAGSILVKVRDSIELVGQSAPDGTFLSGLFSFVAPGGTGSGGSITVETKQLNIRDGAQVFAGTSGVGTAGSVSVNVEDLVELVGTGRTPSRGRTSSAISTSALPRAIGSGGAVTIKTRRLSVRDGATVSSSTLGRGKAGSILIQATEAVDLVGRAIDGSLTSNLSARARSSASAGDLIVKAKQLNIRDGAQLSVRNDGTGSAGTLRVNADRISLGNNGNITATTTSGEGGDIFLNSQNLQLRDGSTISATAGLAGGGGNGGNITIDTDTLAAIQGSSITANAFTGRGGNILITTQGIFQSPDSIFDASSQFGVDGTVEVRNLELEPDEALVPYNEVFIPYEQVVKNSCFAPRRKKRVRLVITDNGSFPAAPGDSVMPMPIFSAEGLEPQTPPPSRRAPVDDNWQVGDPVVEATGIIQTKDGRTLLGMVGSNLPNVEDAICRQD